MSATGTTPPPISGPIPSPEKTLRRLFLTLFLRGRGARGLKKSGAPKSVGQKMGLTLLFYVLFGCMALFFMHQPVFALAAYLHAMTFVFLGMFVASSAGEVLFNKEEADILMHRPISPKVMLWAKIRVLVEVSLWLACAFNLVGMFVGFGFGANWLFPLVHIVSTTLEALFCTGCVVVVYQLCLRWFGRERLDSLMTISQVVISIAAVMAGQILPQLVFRVDHVLTAGELSWWINLLPPAWFAGLDDALAGSGQTASWFLTALAIGTTAIVLWLAFSRLAKDYETGLQGLNETISPKVKKGGHRRLLDRLVNVPPLSWCLRDPVTRASFLLTSAYLLRDRDVKLRVYPGIAPILIIPFVFLIRTHRGASNDLGFGIPFSGIYLGMVPLIGLQLLQYSQQWQAADIFRAAPLPGPAPLCHGARRAVLWLLVPPMFLLMTLVVWVMSSNPSNLIMFIPGLIALPVFALVPNIAGNGVPLSLPIDAAKSATRGLTMMMVMIAAFALAGIAAFARTQGWFWWLVGFETCAAAVIYFILRISIAKAVWPSSE